MSLTGLFVKMIEYYNSDPKRIQHFTKVHSYAKLIGQLENIPEKKLFILETAAIVHDIGIKVSEEKYNSTNGKYQELEGPPLARKMLEELNYDEDVIKRVAYLVGHHHTYDNITELDYQILVEADFLVNLYEDNNSKESCQVVLDKIFRTDSGKMILKEMFGL